MSLLAQPDVFISYSTNDKSWANAACAVLERHQLRCWIAPRDILPGTEWGAAIIQGIDLCKIMLLIFSSHADQSGQVRREVERAISKGMSVLTFRVEEVRPAGAMEYALSNTHWLDGFTPPVERQMESLAETVKILLGKGQKVEMSSKQAQASEHRIAVKSLIASRWFWPVVSVSVLLFGLILWWATSAFQGRDPARGNPIIEKPKESALVNDGFDPLFNGKDMTGWEGLTDYWSVKDGAIVGDTGLKGINFNTYLCSKKEYGDFEMQFKVKLKDGAGNSGVQIRSMLVEKEKDKFVVAGPQCDIATGYWGSLYGERFDGGKMMKAASKEVVEKAVKPKDFNDYYIKVVGKHLIVKLNDETTIEQDFDKMPEKGIIAFQVHGGGPMEVTFKDIKFKDLSK
jgi:hypothetical protein